MYERQAGLGYSSDFLSDDLSQIEPAGQDLIQIKEPGVYLPEGILLPLLGGALSEHVGAVDKSPHAGRPEIVQSAKLLRNVEITRSRRVEVEERPRCRDEGVDATRKVPDAVVDIVGVLSLEPIRDCIALHGQKCGNRRDRDLNAIATAVRRFSIDGNKLIESQGKIGAVGPRHGEVAHKGRRVPCDCGVARH